MITPFIRRHLAAHHWDIHALVALGYAVIYLLIVRMLAQAPWPFAYGLRVACLFLVPYRYWPALALGELLPLGYHNAQHFSDYGWAWCVVASIPPIVLGMPVVGWFRKRAALFPERRLVDISKLLYCTLILSTLWAITAYLRLFTLHLPTGSYPIPAGALFFYWINHYMVLVLFVPWVVMVRMGDNDGSWRLPTIRELALSPLARDTAITVLALVCLMALHHVATDPSKSAMLMSLFLPAAWLTLRRGWRAAVLGGTLSLISMSALVPFAWKPSAGGTFEPQVFMALAMTSLYVFGAHISAQWRLREHAQRTAQANQEAIREGLLFGEFRLQQTSQALESVVDVLRIDHANVLARFVPEAEKNHYSKEAMQLHAQVYRLAESIHPSAWRQRGLDAALGETVAQALAEAGIGYSCQTPGRGLRFLSQAAQAGLYRTACEVVAFISASPACDGVSLTIRSGRYRGVRWVALRGKATRNAAHVATALLLSQERERLAPKLGARMNSLDELRQFVRVFDGTLRFRQIPEGVGLSVLLCDGSLPSSVQTGEATPLRLWVK
ncbi:MASE1 domain-containing protein [Dyella monticola]|nr:MASE1 domain-containing protein [Dyella monticola]